MTLGFAYLCIFLLGFTLALVTGLARRIVHPSTLCDGVIVPSHEHWATMRMPRADLLVSFITVFGLATFLLHGLSDAGPRRELAVGALVAVVGAFVLRLWLCRGADPTSVLSCEGAAATVVRTIPANGYGQVEVSVSGCRVKLAARSDITEMIPVGTSVTVLDRSESVVVVTAVVHATG